MFLMGDTPMGIHVWPASKTRSLITVALKLRLHVSEAAMVINSWPSLLTWDSKSRLYDAEELDWIPR